MKKYSAVISIITAITATLTGCGWDYPCGGMQDINYPETLFKGWELNESNTGLCNDYTKLEPLDPAEAGRLEGSTLFITVPGITISHKEINLQIIVQASGVTIEHCLIKPYSCGRGMPIVVADGACLRDSEIDCSLIPLEQVGFSIAVTGMNFVIERCNIHGASSGISIHNSSNSMISVAQGNYIHGLRLFTDPATGETAHIDGITIRKSSGSGVLVRNNRIETTVPATGPLFIQAWMGYIDNVITEGNLFRGYGNCLVIEFNANGYGGNMQSLNNRFDAWTVQGAGPWYGYVSGGNGWHVWNDNYAYDENAPDCAGDAIPEP